MDPNQAPDDRYRMIGSKAFPRLALIKEKIEPAFTQIFTGRHAVQETSIFLIKKYGKWSYFKVWTSYH